MSSIKDNLCRTKLMRQNISDRKLLTSIAFVKRFISTIGWKSGQFKEINVEQKYMRQNISDKKLFTGFAFLKLYSTIGWKSGCWVNQFISFCDFKNFLRVVVYSEKVC